MTSSRPSASERAPSSFDRLSEPVRRWIRQQGWDELREIQERAIPFLLDGAADVILAAPTAAGKTEAAFLPLLSRIAGQAGRGFTLLSLSPLKALINDQFRRLEGLCQTAGVPVHRWHGDVPASAKARARRTPEGVVLMTPESLEALCVRRGIELAGLFAPLQAVVIDELHAFIGSERGIQLQSLLHRLEIAIGRSVVRVGLSATLGDTAIAAEFLRPGQGDKVVILESRAAGQAVLLQLRGYRRELPIARISARAKARGAEGEPQETAADRAIARHLADRLRGSHNLVFAGSRSNVELYADLLRRHCENLVAPNEFYPHHANLSRGHRETVEARLRDPDLPTTAVCTSTLELGIDIGAVETVAQIGAPWSVAGLRQRLGRSGRRGKPAVMRLYIAERAWRPGLHPADALRFDLVQTIAMVRLLLAGWCEPPRTGALHLSTLVHQILALIAQLGGVSAPRAYSVLCRDGPFRAVTPSLFAQVLRAIGAPEVQLIEQAADGTLLLGEIDERIVTSYDFYAVFETPEEYRIVCDGKALGTLPIVTALVPEMTIIFSGRRWRVIEVQDRQKTIAVAPARTGVPPPFGGEGGDLHDTVVAEMRRVYESEDVPVFLDATARDLLAEARDTYRELGLARRGIVETDGTTYLFPWAGTVAVNTLVLALKDAGLGASMRRMIIEVEHAPTDDVQATLERLAASPLLDPARLAQAVANLEREKYDRFLPRAVLAVGFAANRLAPNAAQAVAQTMVRDRPPNRSC